MKRQTSGFKCALLVLMVLMMTTIVLQAAPFPADVMAWTDTEKAAQRTAGTAVLADIHTQLAAGVKQITVTKGDYRFNTLEGYNIFIVFSGDDYEGVDIDFSGSTLWFEDAYTAFYIGKTSNFTLRNVTIDYAKTVNMQGEITYISSTTSELHLKVDAGYEDVLPKIYSTETMKWRAAAFEPSDRTLKTEASGMSVYMNFNDKTQEGDFILSYRGDYGVTLQNSNLEVGDLLTIMPRISTGKVLRVENNTGPIMLDNVTIYASSGLVITNNLNLGQMTYNNVNIIRRPDTDRLLVGNADGINCSSAALGPIIKDCTIEYLGDDFVNVHTPYNRVVWPESTTQLLITSLGYAYSEVDDGGTVDINFFDRATMQPLGQRTITSVEKVENYHVTESTTIADLDIDPWHSGPAAALRYDAYVTVTRITLDQPITLTDDTITTIEGYMSAGSRITGVTARGSIARGFRLQSPDVVVQDCSISNTCGSGISLGGQPHYWGEGPYVQNAKVLNNIIFDTCAGMAPNEANALRIVQGGDYHLSHIQYDIEVANNVFSDCVRSPIAARGVDQLYLKDNIIDNYVTEDPIDVGYDESIAGYGYAVVLEDCDDVVIANNEISNPGAYAVGEMFTVDVNLADDVPITTYELLGNHSSSYINVEETEDVSPLPWLSETAALAYSDTTTTYGIGCGFRYGWATHASDSLISIAFDYKITDTQTDYLALTAIISNASGTGGPFIKLAKSDGAGGYIMANQTNSGDVDFGIAVLPDTWYRVEVLIKDITQSGDKYSVKVTCEDGNSWIVTDLYSRNNISDIAKIAFDNNTGNQTQGGFVIDNVKVTTAELPFNTINGWSVVGYHGSGIDATVPEETSPFSYINNTAIHYSDTNDSSYGIGAGMNFNFVKEYSAETTEVVFDYQVTEKGDTPLALTASVNDFGSNGCFLMLDYASNGKTWIANRVNAGTTPLMEVAAGKWYRVKMTVEPLTTSSDTYSITVTDEDGVETTFTNIPFRFNIDRMTGLALYNNSNNVSTGSYTVDNVDVQASE